MIFLYHILLTHFFTTSVQADQQQTNNLENYIHYAKCDRNQFRFKYLNSINFDNYYYRKDKNDQNKVTISCKTGYTLFLEDRANGFEYPLPESSNRVSLTCQELPFLIEKYGNKKDVQRSFWKLEGSEFENQLNLNNSNIMVSKCKPVSCPTGAQMTHKMTTIEKSNDGTNTVFSITLNKRTFTNWHKKSNEANAKVKKYEDLTKGWTMIFPFADDFNFDSAMMQITTLNGENLHLSPNGKHFAVTSSNYNKDLTVYGGSSKLDATGTNGNHASYFKLYFAVKTKIGNALDNFALNPKMYFHNDVYTDTDSGPAFGVRHRPSAALEGYFDYIGI